MIVKFKERKMPSYFPICCEDFEKEINKVGTYVNLEIDDKGKGQFLLCRRNLEKVDLIMCPHCNVPIEFEIDEALLPVEEIPVEAQDPTKPEEIDSKAIDESVIIDKTASEGISETETITE